MFQVALVDCGRYTALPVICLRDTGTRDTGTGHATTEVGRGADLQKVRGCFYPGLTLKSSFIAADKDEVTLTLTASNDAKVDFQQSLIVSGLMKAGKETIVRYVPAIPFKIVAKK
jgi:hypothetical protein